MPTIRPLSKLDRHKAAMAGHPIPKPTTAQLAALRQRITDIVASAALGAAHTDYTETNNPVHLLNGFVTARRAGVPVPEWILSAMAAASETVLVSHGTITFDKALGFTPNRGKRTKWTEQEQHLQDARLKWLFDQQLKKGLPLMSDKVGAPSAVKAVADLLGLDADSHDTLRQAYLKRLKPHTSRLSR